MPHLAPSPAIQHYRWAQGISHLSRWVTGHYRIRLILSSSDVDPFASDIGGLSLSQLGSTKDDSEYIFKVDVLRNHTNHY